MMNEVEDKSFTVYIYVECTKCGRLHKLSGKAIDTKDKPRVLRLLDTVAEHHRSSCCRAKLRKTNIFDDHESTIRHKKER